MDFTLVLDGKSFPIAKQNLIAFFELHPCLFDESNYQVQSSVTIEDFAAFLKYLESKQLPEITPANANTLYLLSQEFGVFELSSQCGQLVSDRQTVDSPLMSAVAALTATYLSQATGFESFRRDFPSCMSDSLFSRLDQIKCEVANFSSSNCEELDHTIAREVSKLESRLERDLSDLKSSCNQVRGEIHELAIIPRVFPLRTEDPLNGIIYELTREHGGSICDKGIVRMESETVFDGDVENLLDLWSDSEYCSKDEPGRWVLWEFQESFIRPTHYTIRSSRDKYLKSWLVEGSMDGKKWTELDQRKNDTHLKGNFAVQTFDVKSPVECRFVRLTQTGKNHSESNCLSFCALEIFGTRSRGRFPLPFNCSEEGIISHLTQKHGGNVHDKGIVTITASDLDDRPTYTRKNVADLSAYSYFMSDDEPHQWICWDFHEKRVRPTHYTIET
jgi:hypothetical protein